MLVSFFVAAVITWFTTDISTETREVLAGALHQDAKLIAVQNDRLARYFDLEVFWTNRLCWAIVVKRRKRKASVKVILLNFCCIGRNPGGQLGDIRL